MQAITLRVIELLAHNKDEPSFDFGVLYKNNILLNKYISVTNVIYEL